MERKQATPLLRAYAGEAKSCRATPSLARRIASSPAAAAIAGAARKRALRSSAVARCAGLAGQRAKCTTANECSARGALPLLGRGSKLLAQLHSKLLIHVVVVPVVGPVELLLLLVLAVHPALVLKFLELVVLLHDLVHLRSL